MEVIIKKSAKRKKTTSARMVNNAMHVSAPAKLSSEQLDEIINKFKARFAKRQQKKELNAKIKLCEVFDRLNKKYFSGKLKVSTIAYSTDQDKLFGICDFRKKVIRISHRLASMPIWVRDYVVVHEMAHLIEPNHSKAFWELVYQYKLTERARGYLIAKGGAEDDNG